MVRYMLLRSAAVAMVFAATAVHAQVSHAQVSHAQVSAPGYGMYYIWVVRHLPGNRYTGFRFTEEHQWVLDPAHQGWQPRKAVP